MNGNLDQALAYNPLALVFVPVLLLALVRSLWSWLRDMPLSRRQVVHPYLMWTLLAVLLLFGILRNLPFYPFTLLAPHELVG